MVPLRKILYQFVSNIALVSRSMLCLPFYLLPELGPRGTISSLIHVGWEYETRHRVVSPRYINTNLANLSTRSRQLTISIEQLVYELVTQDQHYQQERNGDSEEEQRELFGFLAEWNQAVPKEDA